ncbi:hypothetical protein [Rhizobium sp. BK176]|uniref:hypothetical protein n=1 Tax=Rhizobium sp. BK176 TaxID=2587071 RepID=UPI002167CDEA|nr:hypothetical protein [Rhizobium sp. BK176]MCS4090164.1 hypothetical protein [Rhizobium sp. BK176]
MITSFSRYAILAGVALLAAACESVPIDQVPDDAVVISGPSEYQGRTKQQVVSGDDTPAPVSVRTPEPTRVASQAPARAAATSSGGFPAPPPDRQSDCTDENSPFVQWINRVQQQASQGGACLNSQGVVLINAEGAKKSRYCAQFYSGTEREQSLQQAEAYEQTAAQARQTAGNTCG